MTFVLFYIAIFLINAIIVSVIENDFVIGFSGSMATLSVIGPGFGTTIGPAGNYETLSPITKMIFMFNMIVGRLELVPFLVLLNKDYWTFKK